MLCMRKHVHGGNALRAIACRAKGCEVAHLRRGVARDVDDARGVEACEPLEELSG